MEIINSDNEMLSSELELLDSMFTSTSCLMLDSNPLDGNNSCLRIVSNKPRFVFHIELRGKGEYGLTRIYSFVNLKELHRAPSFH